ncbi:hypothetical protein TNCV_1418161 [Trichonephila clavipes]|nr:hypothetical protein TNCV_1418161 [Trichonephila clavipes]
MLGFLWLAHLIARPHSSIPSTPINMDEDLQQAVIGKVWDMPGIFANVRSSMRWIYETCIMAISNSYFNDDRLLFNVLFS